MRVVASLRNTFPLSKVLECLGIPRSTYYYRISHPKRDRHEKTRILIRQIFDESKQTYGYRRITYVLRRKCGCAPDKKTVARIMKEEGLKVRQRRKSHYTSYRGTIGKIADNHLKQDFTAKQPWQKLVSDITQFRVGSTNIYLSPLIDLYNGEVISWRIGLRPNMEMVLGMLSDVYPMLCSKNPLVHTDQGLHYQNPQWQILLTRAGCIQSMSRKGNCLDNAAAESFFGKVKTEFSDGSNYKHPKQFMKKLDEWIRWYNEIRIKESLKGMTPVEYRIMNNPSTLESVQV